MSDFALWFTTGLEHIADWQGYDHILFLLVLCAAYSVAEWRQLLVLITAFTLGHSLTLALSVLDVFTVRSSLTEFLIPVTILSTAVVNLYRLRRPRVHRGRSAYLMALGFGCIHGLGFSYLLRSLLGPGETVAGPLFAFNLGLEAGQLIIVAVVLLISLFLAAIFRIKNTESTFFISSAVFGIALVMTIERLNALLTS